MELKRIVPGSGRMLDPKPGDTYLRFEFLLYGRETEPHDTLSDIRGFIGTFSSIRLTVFDVARDDFVEPTYFPFRSDLPRRADAPPDIDRDNPVPSWFRQGFEISRTSDPVELVSVGGFPVRARRYRMAVPERAFPGRNSGALSRPASRNTLVPYNLNLTLIQLAALTKPRRQRWYRAPFNIGVVSQVHIGDFAQPSITHETPMQNNGVASMRSPIVFTGTVSDGATDYGEASGIAGVHLRIRDSSDGTGNEYDFETSQWRPVRTEPQHLQYTPSYKKMDLTDLGGGRWRYLYQWEGGLTGNWYHWTITAVDNRGNELQTSYPFYIDIRPPRVTLVQPSVGRGIVGATAAITVRVDEDFPVLYAIFSIRHVETGNYWDDVSDSWISTPTTFEVDLRPEGPADGSVHVASYEWTPGLDEATFELTVIQTDRATNETVVVQTISYEYFDQTVPEIVVVTPSNGQRYPLGRFRIVGRVKDNLEIDPESAVIETYQVSDDGSESIIAAQQIELHPSAHGWLAFGINQDLRNAPGNYRFLIGVSDTYGNQASEDVAVRVGTG